MDNPLDLLRLVAAAARVVDIVYHVGWAFPALYLRFLLFKVSAAADEAGDSEVRTVLEAFANLCAAFAMEQFLWLTIQLLSQSGVDPEIALALLLIVWALIRYWQTKVLLSGAQSLVQIIGPTIAPILRDDPVGRLILRIHRNVNGGVEP